VIVLGVDIPETNKEFVERQEKIECRTYQKNKSNV
jgi:hypothetical protein